MSKTSLAQRLDAIERWRHPDQPTAHFVTTGPDATGCVRRVRVLGWTFMYTGRALYTQESYRQGGRPFARVRDNGVVVIDDEVLGRVLADPMPAECACRGCAPVAIDDGRRPRSVILATDAVSGFVTVYRPRGQFYSAIRPGDEEIPEPAPEIVPSAPPRCRDCQQEKTIAAEGRCWACLATTRRLERVKA